MLTQSRLRGAPQTAARQLLSDADLTDAEIQFYNDCQDILLGDAVLSDGMISQQDFANAYAELCFQYADGSKNCPGSFDSLSDDLKATFLEAVCDTMIDSVQCKNNLMSLGSMEFGYIVSNQTMPEVQNHVDTLCLELIEPVFALPLSTIPVESPANDGSSFSGPVPATDTTTPTTTTTTDSVIVNEDDEPVEKDKDSLEKLTIAKPSIPNEPEDMLDLPASATSVTGGGSGKFVADSGGSFTQGPILGIVTAASACLLFFVFVVYRKRQARKHDKVLQRVDDVSGTSVDDPESLNQREAPNRKEATPTCSELQMPGHGALVPANTESFFSGYSDDVGTASISRVEDAVDNTNWDEVYKLASQLAEREDLSTLSSADRPTPGHVLSAAKLKRRSHLSVEDQERTKTLDELIENRDWTGVAVTAALYAGESGYHKTPKSYSVSQEKRHSPQWSQVDDTKSDASASETALSLIELRNGMDQAVGAGDWDQVFVLSTEVERNGTFQSRSTDSNSVSSQRDVTTLTPGSNERTFTMLKAEMDRAINAGDWALVGVYSNEMKEFKNMKTEEDGNVVSNAIVPASRPRTINTTKTEDSSSSYVNKKTTIQKLALAQKWKGVSIMAGLYEMESKGALSTDSSGQLAKAPKTHYDGNSVRR